MAEEEKKAKKPQPVDYTKFVADVRKTMDKVQADITAAAAGGTFDPAANTDLVDRAEKALTEAQFLHHQLKDHTGIEKNEALDDDAKKKATEKQKAVAKDFKDKLEAFEKALLENSLKITPYDPSTYVEPENYEAKFDSKHWTWNFQDYMYKDDFSKEEQGNMFLKSSAVLERALRVIAATGLDFYLFYPVAALTNIALGAYQVATGGIGMSAARAWNSMKGGKLEDSVTFTNYKKAYDSGLERLALPEKGQYSFVGVMFRPTLNAVTLGLVEFNLKKVPHKTDEMVRGMFEASASTLENRKDSYSLNRLHEADRKRGDNTPTKETTQETKKAEASSISLTGGTGAAPGTGTTPPGHTPPASDSVFARVAAGAPDLTSSTANVTSRAEPSIGPGTPETPESRSHVSAQVRTFPTDAPAPTVGSEDPAAPKPTSRDASDAPRGDPPTAPQQTGVTERWHDPHAEVPPKVLSHGQQAPKARIFAHVFSRSKQEQEKVTLHELAAAKITTQATNVNEGLNQETTNAPAAARARPSMGGPPGS